MEERSIGLEELSQQTFDPMPVDVGDWVEKLKFDVYELLGWKSKNRRTTESESLPSRYPRLVFFSTSLTAGNVFTATFIR